MPPMCATTACDCGLFKERHERRDEYEDVF